MEKKQYDTIKHSLIIQLLYYTTKYQQRHNEAWSKKMHTQATTNAKRRRIRRTGTANTKYKIANFQPGHCRSTRSIKQKSMKEPSLISKLHSSGLNAPSKAYFPVRADEAAATVVTTAATTDLVEAEAAGPVLVAAA